MTAAPPSADDPRVVEALERYLAAAEAGAPPDRAAFLAEFADVAGPLGDCLSALDFVRRAAGSAPRRLGDYELRREVGRGGMGVVYEAEELPTGRLVAVKVLPAPGPDGAALRRFRHEARAAALLDHPHVVPVYAVGRAGADHYIAMKLVDGRSLAELPAPVLPREAARLTVQAADALAHAHAAGGVHRDVKPANLLLDGRGHLWVADFGLALLPGATRATGAGGVVGTLRYMSPEQADPARGVADHRADLYGLGCVLYELLTGRPALDEEEPGAALAALLGRDPVPPRRWNRAAPADLEAVALKLLEKEPADRYPTASAAADDLRRYLAGQAMLARRPSAADRLFRAANRRRRAVGLAAALLAAFVATLSVNQVRLTRERDATRAERGAAREAVDRFVTHFAEHFLAGAAGAEPEALKLLAEARGHYDRLAASESADRGDRLAAAAARRRVADLSARLGDRAGADAASADAVERLQGLTAAEPGWAEADRELAAALADRGALLRGAGRLPEAGAAYRESAALFGRLADRGDARDRAGLAGVENNQGVFWMALDRPGEAADCFRAAARRFARLSAEAPAQRALSASASAALHNLGDALAESGRDADAEAAYADALALRAGAITPAARLELARTQLALAAARRRAGDGSAARRLAADALTLCERLAAESPRVPDYRLHLARALRATAEAGAPDAAARLDRAARLLRPLPGAGAELALTLSAAGTAPARREAAEVAARLPGASAFERRVRDACRPAPADAPPGGR